VSRRAFLKAGGAGAAASTLGVTALTPTAAQAAFRPGHEADVIIVGSGAAAAVAAIAARSRGASVTMLERSPVFGGTSAKSAGMVWVPNNFRMKERGLADPREPFIAYCTRYSYPQVYDPKSPTMGLSKDVYDLIAAFYDNASVMIDALRDMKALRVGRYHVLPEGEAEDLPDYFEHAEENKAPRGRGIGALKRDGSLGFGDELMGQLKAKLDELKVPVLFSHRVNRLLLNSRGEAIGVEASHGDKTVSVRARRAVIFGTGGYTYNKELLQSHQVGPVYGGCGVPTCTGDFIPIATAAGAKLGNMGGAWRAQIVLEEALQYISVPNDVWQPQGDSMVIVNKYGHRVFNEKRNYHDRSRVQHHYDPNKAEFPNQLTFMVYDQRTADLYGGNHPIPQTSTGASYVITGDTLSSLADAIEQRLERLAGKTGNIHLDAKFSQQLGLTVERFNRFAEAGKDEDFQRGDYKYDRELMTMLGQPKSNTKWGTVRGKNPVLYPLQPQGPYYCIILAPGTLDTNGGPVIDAKGHVVRHDGKPVPGLYGAGNCIASPAHNSYWGGGATLGTGMTFGYLAGLNAAGETAKAL